MSVVAVTGATGFIGRAVVSTLVTAGHIVVAVARGSAVGATQQVRGVLGEGLDLRATPVPDLVIHLAHDFASDAVSRNINGTLRWFDDFAAHGATRQVLLSSLSALVETKTPYARSKQGLEAGFAARGQPTLRPGLVVGRGGLFGALSKVMRLAPLTAVPGHGAPSLYLTTLPDLVGRLLAMLPPSPAPLTTNVITWGPVSFAELAAGLRAAATTGLVLPVPNLAFSCALGVGATVVPRLRGLRDSYANLVATDLLLRRTPTPTSSTGPMTASALQQALGAS